MKTFMLANFLIGSLLLSTTAMADEKCNGKTITNVYNTKANTDRKNWEYIYPDSGEFVIAADSNRGDIFNYEPKNNDVLQVKGTGYVQIVVGSFSGNLSICADPTAAIDLFFKADYSKDGKDKSGTLFVSGGDRSDFINLLSLKGNATIYGNGGDDELLDARHDKAFIDGGEGNDYIEGFGGDLILGGSGKDFISVDATFFDDEDAMVDGGSGDDIIIGGHAKDLILGGSGKDLIMLSGIPVGKKGAIGNPGTTNSFVPPEFFDRNNWEYFDDNKVFTDDKGGQVSGEEGNDIIYGSDGDDQILGGTGDDTIKGANGNDLIYGDAGNDSIWGSSGDDEIYGGTGDDLLKGGSGNDVIKGEEGKDIIYGENGNDRLFGGTGDDTIDGGNDDDLVSGDEDKDHLKGGSGNDVITLGVSNGKYIREGGDTYRNTCGGLGGCIAGNSMLAVKSTRDNHGGDVDGGSGNDDIYGTDGNSEEDYLVGGSGQDVIWGFGGTNNIHGGDNNDFLIGGDGSDHLYGDDGWDMCWGRGDAGCND